MPAYPTSPAPASLAYSVDVRRAESRFATKNSWLESRHSFSFGSHYDSRNINFGLLMVNNDDVVQPDTGFDRHRHEDMEIVTWVLSGHLVHEDSEGNFGVIYPGLAQRMSAGRGIMHAERNDSKLPELPGDLPRDLPVHFVQMWVVPDEPGIDPGYEQIEIIEDLQRGGLVPVASGMLKHEGAAAVRIKQKDAAFHAAHVRSEGSVALPSAPYVHLFVTRGAVDLEGVGRLDAGDAVRITASDGQRVNGIEPAEILVWEMHARLGTP